MHLSSRLATRSIPVRHRDAASNRVLAVRALEGQVRVTRLLEHTLNIQEHPVHLTLNRQRGSRLTNDLSRITVSIHLRHARDLEVAHLLLSRSNQSNDALDVLADVLLVHTHYLRDVVQRAADFLLPRTDSGNHKGLCLWRGGFAREQVSVGRQHAVARLLVIAQRVLLTLRDVLQVLLTCIGQSLDRSAVLVVANADVTCGLHLCRARLDDVQCSVDVAVGQQENLGEESEVSLRDAELTVHRVLSTVHSCSHSLSEETNQFRANEVRLESNLLTVQLELVADAPSVTDEVEQHHVLVSSLTLQRNTGHVVGTHSSMRSDGQRVLLDGFFSSLRTHGASLSALTKGLETLRCHDFVDDFGRGEHLNLQVKQLILLTVVAFLELEEQLVDVEVGTHLSNELIGNNHSVHTLRQETDNLHNGTGVHSLRRDTQTDRREHLVRNLGDVHVAVLLGQAVAGHDNLSREHLAVLLTHAAQRILTVTVELACDLHLRTTSHTNRVNVLLHCREHTAADQTDDTGGGEHLGLNHINLSLRNFVVLNLVKQPLLELRLVELTVSLVIELTEELVALLLVDFIHSLEELCVDGSTALTHETDSRCRHNLLELRGELVRGVIVPVVGNVHLLAVSLHREGVDLLGLQLHCIERAVLVTEVHSLTGLTNLVSGLHLDLVDVILGVSHPSSELVELGADALNHRDDRVLNLL